MTTAGPRTPHGQGPADDAQAPRDDRSAEERAEEIVERVSAQAMNLARRLVARAREEAEDIVAEAQSLRHRARPPE